MYIYLLYNQYKMKRRTIVKPTHKTRLIRLSISVTDELQIAADEEKRSLKNYIEKVLDEQAEGLRITRLTPKK